MKSEYNLDDSDLVLLASATQTFVKRTIPAYLEENYEETYEDHNSGHEFPYTCTNMPWNQTTQSLWTSDEPGETNAMCTFNEDYYCKSQQTLNYFYEYFLANYQNTSSDVSCLFVGLVSCHAHNEYFAFQTLCTLEMHLKELSVEKQCEAFKLIVSRFAFDGEMAGSGAAQDPLFWVAHGAVERLLQKVIFENVSSDLIYDAESAHCTGHMNDVRNRISHCELCIIALLCRGPNTG